MAERATLVIGTRGSPLALAQAREAQARLSVAHAWPVEQLPLAVIRTTGDAIQDRPLSEAGGKGLFTRELDIALLEGTIDVAVHSAKDLPTALPESIVIAGCLPREDVRDAFISLQAASLRDLRPGAVVGSASLRRQAQIRRLRPDLRVTLLRGNVQTRLGKLEHGEVDATLLAMAGLSRLGLTDHATAVLDPEDFLPAVGQGAIAIVIRADDGRTHEAVRPILDAPTGLALVAERAFLAVLDGSCRTPIAGWARFVGDDIEFRGQELEFRGQELEFRGQELEFRGQELEFRGQVLRPDGSDSLDIVRRGPAGEAARLGREAGRALLAQMPDGFLTA